MKEENKQQIQDLKETKKRCTKCGENKVLSEFHKRTAAADGLNFWCKLCMREYSEQHRKKPEVIESRRKYYIKYAARAEVIEQRKRYRKEYRSRPEVKKKRREVEAIKYRSKPGYNKRRVAWVREYSARPEVIEQKKEYYSRPDIRSRYREHSLRRYARKLNATIGKIDVPALYDLCENCCVYCGSTHKLTLDHIVALSQGGAHCQDNLLVACQSCNSSKNARDIEEWLDTQPEEYRQRYVACLKKREERVD